MARLDPLIRYRKHLVEEKQRVLAELLRQVEALETHKKERIEELQQETQKMEFDRASGRFESWEYFGLYAQGIREKIMRINLAIRKLEERITKAQDEVREAFSEVKKIEIVARHRKEAEDQERARKDSAELNEMAITRYAAQDEERS